MRGGRTRREQTEDGCTAMIVVVIVLAVVVACAAGIAGGSLLAGRTHDASLAREMRRLTEEQRRASDEGRDAAIQVAMQQLREMNAALSDGERARSGAELDGKKALIDHEIVTMRDGITAQLQK